MSRVDAGLLTVTEEPFNAETPLAALEAGVTPTAVFFVRCNFAVPRLDAASWRLRVGGLVERPAVLSLAELQALPRHEVAATVECAGNGRKLMTPVPPGTAWELGAVSTGVFGGTSLRGVLEACGVAASAVEVVFEAADGGVVESGVVESGVVESGVVEGGESVRFARSLPLEKALHPDTLLAWSLNGEPLAAEHGYPVRLFVPGWYGVASVKWLSRIDAVASPFTGHFQTERYIYEAHADYADGEPVTRTHVRSLITRPAAGERLRLSGSGLSGSRPITISGVAWSGFGAVAAVEISDDGGTNWAPARLGPAASDYAARGWTYDWLPARGAGEYEILARATDEAGRTQPLEPPWNRLGYANNVVHRVALTVEE